MKGNPDQANVVTFVLEPFHHLKYERAEDAWIAVGNDPSFYCRSAALPLAAGWYQVELNMHQLAGPEMWPYFYPDYGNSGSFESQKIFLPFFDKDLQTHRGIVRFTHDVFRLRFDPSVTVGRFRLGNLSLRRVGKVEAAREMLRHMLKRPTPWSGKAGWLLGLLARGLLGGPGAFAVRLVEDYLLRPQAGISDTYQTWIGLYDAVTPGRIEKARNGIAALPRLPVVSIVLPVYNTPERWLRRCIGSVQAQIYDRWELCIANDASTAPHVARILDEMARRDARIKVVHRKVNGHISACSNSAIELAGGHWLALLDHDDELHPMALAEVVLAAAKNPGWRLIYSDEDKIDQSGRRFDPYLKPDWNYDLFLSHNCISHLGVYDADLLREVGGFREGMEGSQDWDLALRCIERLAPAQIGHIPHVLYHWRAIAGSTALAPQEKDYAHDAGMRAIDGHLKRIGSAGQVQDIPGQRGNYRIRYPIPTPAPLVSIIIPTRDAADLLKSCVESVIERTSYPNYELIIVDNQSEESDALVGLAELARDARVRVLTYDHPFNYPEINNFAVRHAGGSVLCLLNNDITVITTDWLEEMVGHALRPRVGAVGAMLYYPNEIIQHAGVIVGAHGVAAHAYNGRPRGYSGHMSRARLTQEMSAVTAACLVVTRDVYERVGGLDPALSVAFNDVDFCLRLRALGLRNIWTPFAELYHHESASRGYENSPEKLDRFNAEMAFMRERWGEVLNHDPAYSLNFDTANELFELAFPPREISAGAVDERG